MTKQKTARILLINPPVYDLRLDWARWHQPCGLLQVGRLLRLRGTDVRLIDCLQPERNKLERKKLDTVTVDEQNLIRWHFGCSWELIEKQIGLIKDENWKPDAIYVTTMMTFWWESTRDLIHRIRKEWFPRIPIVLGGVYPTLCPGHAKKHIRCADFDLEIADKARIHATDLTLYNQMPYFSGLFLSRRVPPERIVGEIVTKAKLGVREFAFFDNEIGLNHQTRFEKVLDQVIEKELDVKFRALGNISPKVLSGSLVRKMKAAGYRQIFLRDDIALRSNSNGDLSSYERGIELMLKYGGFKPRTEDLTAMVVVGVPGENLNHVVERLTKLAHIVGSVNLVPYQPTPGTEIFEMHKSQLPAELERQNGKLFPFAKVNGATFSDYQQLMRLAALLNSKYHSTTFDFLGNDEIAQMVRKSVAEERWQPRIKETIPLSPR
jgi:radical SAM superfamily enzyme YgiQ (UPF0313 family)